MTIIWAFMLMAGIIYSILTGTADNIIQIISTSCEGVGGTVLTLAGMMCFWNGIFNIIKHTPIVNWLSKGINKVLGLFMKKEEMSKEAKENMSLNIATNMLGVGNAATASGIKTMEELNKTNKNKDKATDNMTLFVVLNTASLQLFPTTMITLRQMYGSPAPTRIVLAVWICSFVSLIVGIIAIRLLNKKI